MKYSVLIFVSFLFLTCSSSDDSDNSGNPQTITGDYFPNATGDMWTYEVESTSTTNPIQNFTGTDNVSIASGANSNNFTVDVNGVALAFGAANFIFESGSFTKTNSTLDFTGNTAIQTGISIFPQVDISVADVFIYDLNASNNTTLSTVNSSDTESIDINGTPIPTTIEYTITTKKLPNVSALTVRGQTYTNVIVSELIVNLSVNLNLPSPIGSQFLLPAQNVLTMTLYFVEDVGLIKADTLQNYNLNESLITTVTNLNLFPDLGTLQTNSSVENIQDLDSYMVN